MSTSPRSLSAGLLALAFLATPVAAAAQSLPARVRVTLEGQGHDRVADRLADRMEPRSSLDRGDVEDLLDRWERANGGPADAWGWLTASRLWLRAGEADRARDALNRAREGLPAGTVALEEARIAFLDGDLEVAGQAYWRACAEADELSALEAWRDMEVLATPDEVEAWDRFRRLPVAQRDDCTFVRAFWNERAARSGVSTEERISLHYARLRFAMDHYVRRGRAQDVAASGKLNARLGREGAPRFDDRGMLYLRLGPPDETARTIGGDCYEPNVSWYYRFPEGDRLFHLSPLGGNDNWWLLGNLAEVFRCPVDERGNIRRDRNPMIALAPNMNDIPPDVVRDMYVTRAQLDPRYARMAYQFDAIRALEVLQDERDLTWADGLYAVTEVPERPDVKMDVGMIEEWVAFRTPLPDRTRVWLFLLMSGEDMAEAVEDEDEGIEVVVSALATDGRQERTRVHVAPPTPGTNRSVRIPMELPPGEYETRVIARTGPPRAPGDEDRQPASGGYITSRMTVPQFGGALPRLSGIAVSPDSGGAWAQAEGYGFSPQPVHASNEQGTLWIYFEAYNLTPDGRYTANVVLEPDGGGTPFSLEFTGAARGGGRVVTPVGLRIDLREARSGEYALTLTVRDQATGRVTLPARTVIQVPSGQAAPSVEG